MGSGSFFAVPFLTAKSALLNAHSLPVSLSHSCSLFLSFAPSNFYCVRGLAETEI